jgi:hypothetical protein
VSLKRDLGHIALILDALETMVQLQLKERPLRKHLAQHRGGSDTVLHRIPFDTPRKHLETGARGDMGERVAREEQGGGVRWTFFWNWFRLS